jgi:hypothetical protein
VALVKLKRLNKTMGCFFAMGDFFKKKIIKKKKKKKKKKTADTKQI